MVRRRKPTSRFVRYPRRWPVVVAAAGGVLAGAATLVELAYLIGRANPKAPGTLDAILTATSSPATAVAVAFGALVLGAWGIRQLLLQWLAWRPGRIEVGEFTEGTTLTDANAEQLTARFRGMLARLQLQAPTPVPGAAPEGDFLDVLGRSGVDSRNVLGTLLSVIRAAKPTHAYEVRGVLLERDERPRFGIGVHVLRIPSESTLPVQVWGETWEIALERAADEATGAILPRTRRCRAPWAGWYRHAMPPGLVHAYESAARLEQGRRYDEALSAYFQAVSIDPMNMVLRLRIGLLQERLGLYMDALATYWGMCVASRPAGSRLPRRLYRGRGRRERRRALLSARYRRNVLLGGRVLAKQWNTAPEKQATRRDKQRKRLRGCLGAHLARELAPLAGDQDLLDALHKPALDEEQLFHALQHPPLDDELLLEVRWLMARYAIRDCRRLRWALLCRFFDRRSTLTPAAIRLTEECIAVRQEWVKAKLKVTQRPKWKPKPKSKSKSKSKSKPAWPPDPRALERRIRRVELGWWRFVPALPSGFRSFHTWHEHYNAACAFALALQDSGLDRTTRRALAERAVCRLEKATGRADSAYIGSRRDWLVSEDPDLTGLRTTTRFKRFEMMYLPSAEVTPRRPVNVQQLESSRYVRKLLVVTARRWETTWHERGRNLGQRPDIHVLLGWFGDELRAWGHVRTVAQEYRHSKSRLDLIDSMRRFGDEYGFDPLGVSFPRYEEDPLPDTEETDGSCDHVGGKAVDKTSEQLAAIAEMLPERGTADPATQLVAHLNQWQTSLRWLDTSGRQPSVYVLARLCDHHAALWQLLEQWLEADGATACAKRDFCAKAKETRRLWCAALALSQPVSKVLTATRERNGSEPAVAPLLRSEALSTWWYARVAMGDWWMQRRTRANGHGPVPARSVPGT